MRRVVVTGLGTINPLGNTVESSWKSLIESKSGIKLIDKFDVNEYPCKIAATIEDSYINQDIVSSRDLRKIDRFIALGLVAADEAIKDSGFVPNEENTYTSGVMVGSGIGGLDTIYKNSSILDNQGIRKISPFFIPSALINLISGQVSIRFGYRGPNHAVVTACSTGAHAIGDATRLIAFDDADVMLAGGAEAAVCRLGIAGFAAARALSTSYNDTPEVASRPYDKGRDGFVMGEGAGVVVLEELEHAKARGAKIYGEVKGYGLSGDAHHITAPAEDGNGGFRSMEAALKRAGLDVSEIDYINAHGTSTPLGDVIEANAVRRLLGAESDVSMSSTKSSTGHLLGAAGAIEAIISTMAVEQDIVPPTLNLREPEPKLDGLDLVPLKAKKRSVRNAMSNSFGFGGTNASLIIGKVDT